MTQKAMDWPFAPSAAELEDLNKLRDYHRLTRIEKVTMASEWFRACFEIDECAEASEPNKAVRGAAEPRTMDGLVGRGGSNAD